jgi:ubiquinone/menaquinone biosynthesis C-methylase UbiE
MNSTNYPHQDTNRIHEYFRHDAESKKDFYKTKNHEQIHTELSKRTMWKTYQKTLDELISNYEDLTTICDLGCGMGNFLFEIISKDHFDQIIGIDNLIETMKIALKEKKLFQQACFIQADILSLPLKNNSIDVVFCLNVLHHFQKNIFEKAIHEITRITKNIMILEIRNQKYLGNFLLKKIIIPHSYHDLPIYSYDTSYVTNLLQNLGFELVICRGNKKHNKMNRRLLMIFQRKNKGGLI